MSATASIGSPARLPFDRYQRYAFAARVVAAARGGTRVLRLLEVGSDVHRDLERFVRAFDNKHTIAIEPKLKALKAPTLIVWGTDDVYFDVKWSHWLASTIPGTKLRERRATISVAA